MVCWQANPFAAGGAGDCQPLVLTTYYTRRLLPRPKLEVVCNNLMAMVMLRVVIRRVLLLNIVQAALASLFGQFKGPISREEASSFGDARKSPLREARHDVIPNRWR